MASGKETGLFWGRKGQKEGTVSRRGLSEGPCWVGVTAQRRQSGERKSGPGAPLPGWEQGRAPGLPYQGGGGRVLGGLHLSRPIPFTLPSGMPYKVKPLWKRWLL